MRDQFHDVAPRVPSLDYPSVVSRFRRMHCPDRLRIGLARADDAPSPTRYTHMQRGTRLVTCSLCSLALAETHIGHGDCQ